MPGIIVGVDGSAHSQWALERAMSEAVARHAPLTVLSVHSWGAVTGTEGGLNLDQAAEEVQALVDQAVNRRPGPALPVTVGVITGSPAVELIRAARDADLLVVGARHRRLDAAGGRLGDQPGGVPGPLPGGHHLRASCRPAASRAGCSEPDGHACRAASRGHARRCLTVMIFSNDPA